MNCDQVASIRVSGGVWAGTGSGDGGKTLTPGLAHDNLNRLSQASDFVITSYGVAAGYMDVS